MSIPKTVAQIVEIVKANVASGKSGWEPGTKLPTYKDLAKQMRCSPATVGRAVKVLRHEGVLVGVRGEGVWVAERP